MDRLRLGLILLLSAHVAWLVAVLVKGIEGYTAALVVALVGVAVATWAVPAGQRLFGAIGFGLAALGIAMFYDFAFFQGLPETAGTIVVIGHIVAAIAVGVDTWRVLAVGLALSALGAALWIYADGTDAMEWQVGNVLAFVGSTLAGLGAAVRTSGALP